MTTLTASDHRVFQAIARYIREHSQSPTRRELQRALTTDAQAIEHALGALVDAGCIAVEPHTWRNIRIVKDPPALEVKKCTKDGCNEPQHKNYDWCHAHMQEAWRKRENKRRKTPPGTPKQTNNLHGPMTFVKGQKVRLEMIDWVSEKVFAFEATATGTFTVIPEREDGQFTRIKDVMRENGSLTVIVLRGEA